MTCPGSELPNGWIKRITVILIWTWMLIYHRFYSFPGSFLCAVWPGDFFSLLSHEEVVKWAQEQRAYRDVPEPRTAWGGVKNVTLDNRLQYSYKNSFLLQHADSSKYERLYSSHTLELRVMCQTRLRIYILTIELINDFWVTQSNTAVSGSSNWLPTVLWKWLCLPWCTFACFYYSLCCTDLNELVCSVRDLNQA